MKQRCSNCEGSKAETVRLYAAGSLRAALTVAARAFEEKQPSARIELEFGRGPECHAHHSTGHNARSYGAGRHVDPQSRPIGRLRVCAVCEGGYDPAWRQSHFGRQGTATHWRTDIVEGPGRHQPVCLGHEWNARLAAGELPELKIVNIPPELKIVADYGLVVLENAPPAAVEFARFIVRDEGQSILTSYGFGRADPPDD